MYTWRKYDVLLMCVHCVLIFYVDSELNVRVRQVRIPYAIRAYQIMRLFYGFLDLSECAAYAFRYYAFACLANFFFIKSTLKPPVEAITTSCDWSFQSTACFEKIIWIFRYLTPTYSRCISFGNMQSVIVSFVFYSEIVFYLPHLSVKACKFNS